MSTRDEPPGNEHHQGNRDARTARPILIEKFRFRACFGRAAGLVWRNWWLFLAICTLFYGFGNILNIYQYDTLSNWFEVEIDATGSLGLLVLWFLWGTLLGLPGYFFSVVADAIIAYIVVAQLRGQRCSPADVVSRLGTVFVPLLLFSVVDYLAVSVGYYFMQIPLLIFAIFFWLSVQSLSVENLGAFAAMKRSMFLTSGNRLRFGCVVLAIFVMWEIDDYAVELLATLSFYPMFGFSHTNFLDLFAGGIMGSYIAALLATAYHDLRSLKEDTPEQRAIETFE